MQTLRANASWQRIGAIAEWRSTLL